MRIPFSNKSLTYEFDFSYTSNYTEERITYHLNIPSQLVDDLEQAYFKVLIKEASEYQNIQPTFGYVSGIRRDDVFYMIECNSNNIISTCIASNSEPEYLLFDITTFLRKAILDKKNQVSIYVIRHTDDNNSIVKYRFIDYLDTKYNTFYGYVIKKNHIYDLNKYDAINSEVGTFFKNFKNDNLIFKSSNITIEDPVCPLQIAACYNDYGEFNNEKISFNFAYYVMIYDNKITLRDYCGNNHLYYETSLWLFNELNKTNISTQEFNTIKANLGYSSGGVYYNSFYYNYEDSSYLFYDKDTKLIYIFTASKNKIIISLAPYNNDETNPVRFLGKTLLKISNNNYTYQFIWNSNNTLKEIRNNNSVAVLRLSYDIPNQIGILNLTNNLRYEFGFNEFLNFTTLKIYKVPVACILPDEYDLLHQYNFIYNAEGKITKVINEFTKTGIKFDYLSETNTLISKIFIKENEELSKVFKSYTVNLENNITTITDEYGNFIDMYFDQNDEIIQIIDDKNNYYLNNVIVNKGEDYYKYNYLINCNNKENYIVNGQFDNEVKIQSEHEIGTWSIPNTINFEIVEDNYLTSITGNKAIKLNNNFYAYETSNFYTNTIHQLIEANLLQGQTYAIEIWGKSLGNNASSVIVDLKIEDNNLMLGKSFKYSLTFQPNIYMNYVCIFESPFKRKNLSLFLSHIGSSSTIIKNIKMYRIGPTSVHLSHIVEDEQVSDENNKTTYVKNKSQLLEYIYDDNNRISKIINHFTGTVNNYNYDTNNNIINVEIVNASGEKLCMNSLYTKYNLLDCYKDENNYFEEYNYDDMLNLTESIDAGGNCNQKQYQKMNNNENLYVYEKNFINDYNNQSTYLFNNKQQLKSIFVNNDFQYNFFYELSNLSKEQYVNTKVSPNISYDINEYIYNNNDMDKLSIHKNYLTNSQIQYIYNSDGSISVIKVKNINENDDAYQNYEKYSYYSDTGKLKKITSDYNVNYDLSFDYNEFLNLNIIKSKMGSKKFVINEYLNNDGAIWKKDYKLQETINNNTSNNFVFTNTYLNHNDISLMSKLLYFSQHYLNDYSFGSMKKPFYTFNNLVEYVDTVYDSTIGSPVLLFDKTSSCLIYDINELNKNRKESQYYGIKKYNYDEHRVKLGFNFIMLFKVDDQLTQERILFSFTNDSKKVALKYKNSALYLVKKEEDNITETFVCYINNTWNLLQLTTSGTSSDNYKIGININPVNDLETNKNFQYEFDGINFVPSHISIGESYISGKTAEYYKNNLPNNNTDFRVAFYSIGNDEVTFYDFYQLYQDIKTIENATNKQLNQTTYLSLFNGKYDIIEFNKNLISLEGNHPTEFNYTITYDLNNFSKIFEYDYDLKRYVYRSCFNSYGSYANKSTILGYDLGLYRKGSICVRFNIKSDGHILSNLFFSSDSGFSEYLDFCLKDNKLIIESSYEKTSYDTGITISKNTWHTLYFEFDYDTLKIKLDNNSVEKKFDTNISFSNFTTYLGCSNAYDEFQITDCAFDVLAYTSELNDELYDTVKNYRPSHIKNFYKDDGRIEKKELLLNWNTFVTNYHYLVKENKSKTLPDYVEDYLGNFVYYGYDNINNITNITNIVKLNDNNYEIESNYFEYNYLKQLSKDEYRGYSHHLKHEYTYTDNGNINSVIKTNLNNNEIIEYKYEYNNDIPNVLIKVTKCSNGEENDFYSLTYDENNPLKLTSYTKEGITYNVNYTANKISSIGNINFYYDTYGNRIEKTTPTETIYYQYDGNKLILTRNTNTNVDVVYLYDNDEVIGFYTQNNYFLYEKDLTGNIIGIIDNAKVLLVKYIYNGYGVREAIIPDSLTLEQQELANFLINNNHLAYKGYIYDVETSLFWLSSRYYSPELCRFISPDDVEYLDPESVNGLNLYCYCFNNPIMYADPDGHSPKWWQWALFGVGVTLVAVAAGMAIIGTGGVAAFGAGALVGSLAVGAGGAIVGGAIGYAVDGVDGIFGGALAGFGIGSIVGFAVGGCIGLNTWNSDVRMARQFLTDNGVDSAYHDNIINSFKYRIKTKTINSDMTVYRYYSDSGRRISYWVTPKQYANPVQRLALAYGGNTAQNTATLTLQKGAQILYGKVARVGSYLGGGIQYYVPNLAWLI